MQANSIREVWFIRHSESVANAGARTREAPTYPLSDFGFRQAADFAGALSVEPELIVVSPYIRARQTAEPAIRRFRRATVEVWPVHEVQYLAPSLCVDTTQDDRRELSLEYWERADPRSAAPGAESFAEFIARAADTVARLARRPERRVFVFSHGHFMSAVAWLNLTRPEGIDSGAMRSYREFIHAHVVPNCAILPLHWHSDGACSLGRMWVPEGVGQICDGPARAGIASVGPSY